MMKSQALFATFNSYTAYFLLCLIGGFIDTVGFLGFFMVFTGSVTGNIILAVCQILPNSKYEGALCRTFVSLSFGLGSLLTNFVYVILKHKHHLSLRVISSIMFIVECLLLSMFVGTIYHHEDLIEHVDSLATIAYASILAFCMGIQASIVCEFNGYPATTIVTQTFVIFSGAISKSISYSIASYYPTFLYAPKITNSTGTDDLKSGLLKKIDLTESDEHTNLVKLSLHTSLYSLLRSFVTLSGFIIGCIFGVFGWQYFKFFSVIFPSLLLIVLAIDLLLPINDDEELNV